MKEMMTHPEVVRDDGANKQAVHDVVSILLHHRLHTKNRNAGRLFKVLGLTAPPPGALWRHRRMEAVHSAARALGGALLCGRN